MYKRARVCVHENFSLRNTLLCIDEDKTRNCTILDLYYSVHSITRIIMCVSIWQDVVFIALLYEKIPPLSSSLPFSGLIFSLSTILSHLFLFFPLSFCLFSYSFIFIRFIGFPTSIYNEYNQTNQQRKR